jgi:hypothetical protein
MSRNEEGLTFEEWMAKVDRVIAAHCGLGSGDLADQTYWDWWNDGVSPRDAAEMTLEDEGFPFE